jgi:hypothetical protein
MALTFSSNDLIKASALVSAAPMTFACWATFSSLAADSYLMSITSATSTHNSEFSMLVKTSDSKARCFISNDAGSTTDATAVNATVLSTSTLYHIACVFTSATSRTCYVNGANPVTSAVSVTPGTCDTTCIGASKVNAAYKYSTATIAFPAIWSAALSASEIGSLAEKFGPTRIHPAARVSYARLTGGNNPEPDLNGFTWTLEHA